jgi:hypothetical protein
MAANPTRYARKGIKNGSSGSICLTCFASTGGSTILCGGLTDTHVCDSAFLAERGIFTRLDNGAFQEESIHKLPFNHVQAA